MERRHVHNTATEVASGIVVIGVRLGHDCAELKHVSIVISPRQQITEVICRKATKDRELDRSIVGSGDCHIIGLRHCTTDLPFPYIRLYKGSHQPCRPGILSPAAMSTPAPTDL